MATFGSYGNLGGELVNVIEVNELNNGPTGGGTASTVNYTCPTGRYALVITRNFSLVNNSGTCNLQFIYSGTSTFQYTGNLSYNESTMKDKILSEGESIVTNRTLNGQTNINFLVFEYRKP